MLYMNAEIPNYTLNQILAFAGPAADEQRELIQMLLNAAQKNLASFQKEIAKRNRAEVCEIAHKMLTLFRQLEAEQITASLEFLEKTNSSMADSQYFEQAEQTARLITVLLSDISQKIETGEF